MEKKREEERGKERKGTGREGGIAFIMKKGGGKDNF